MNQRRTVSWLLPIVGLLFVASELQRLFEARAAAEACLERARTELILCVAGPDALFFVVAVAFGLVFVARLAYLALQYYRSVH
jgi:tellurite resistance protein TehA-like permease